MRLVVTVTMIFAALAGSVRAEEQLALNSGKLEILGGMQDPAPYFPNGKRAPSQDAVLSFERQPQGTGKLETKIVAYDGHLPAGSVLVRTHARQLFYILPDGQAILYPVGVGREGFTWSGENVVSRKAEWPDWRPPKRMIEREFRQGKIIPAFVAGGPNNPLGARALYIGNTEFRIHGTTQPWSIGRAVSSGCIRMLNEHVIELYDRVAIGARVVVE